MFKIVSEVCYGRYYTLYVAKEQYGLGLAVSIKDIPMSFMDLISQELLVYKELEERKVDIWGVLALFQSQIDFNSYLLVKEPYTQTLQHYLQ
jgi:hypothetical protein